MAMRFATEMFPGFIEVFCSVDDSADIENDADCIDVDSSVTRLLDHVE
jgi:hypothetical protein